MEEVVMMVAADPEIGTVIPGGGGIRKFRYASQEGRGKRGGARVIYLGGDGKGQGLGCWTSMPRAERKI
jgi:hypothetical protein